jgi:hypothetical protein
MPQNLSHKMRQTLRSIPEEGLFKYNTHATLCALEKRGLVSYHPRKQFDIAGDWKLTEAGRKELEVPK